MTKILVIDRNRPLGHADQLYTYKGHILSVGLTEKWQKMTKIAILSQNKAQIQKPINLLLQIEQLNKIKLSKASLSWFIV